LIIIINIRPHGPRYKTTGFRRGFPNAVVWGMKPTLYGCQ